MQLEYWTIDEQAEGIKNELLLVICLYVEAGPTLGDHIFSKTWLFPPSPKKNALQFLDHILIDSGHSFIEFFFNDSMP